MTGAYGKVGRPQSPGRQQPGVTAAIVGARAPRHVDGWRPGAGLELGDRELVEIGEAISETGAGSADPPVPPPHMRPATYVSDLTA